MAIKHKRPELKQADTLHGLLATLNGKGLHFDEHVLSNAIRDLKEYIKSSINDLGRINVETGDIPELVIIQRAIDLDAEFIANELDDIEYGQFEDITGIDLESIGENWIDDSEIVVYGCVALALEQVTPKLQQSTISAGYEEVVSWVDGKG